MTDGISLFLNNLELNVMLAYLRFCTATFFCFIFLQSASAQMQVGPDILYGNEWIDFEKTYYKIKVPEDGIYRISYAAMADHGIPVDSLIGSDFQLFHFGTEIPIFLTDTGQLSSSSYLEFHAHKNRGELDTFLYSHGYNAQFNPEYSLYTDTAVYFLTWNTSSPGLRYEQVANILTDAPPADSFYLHQELYCYSTKANDPIQNNDRISYSHYEEAEGFAEAFGLSTTKALAATNVYANGPTASINLRVGTNRYYGTRQVHLDNVLQFSQVLSGNQMELISLDVPVNMLTGTMSLTISSAYPSEQGIATIELEYPRHFDFRNQDLFYFKIAPGAAPRYFEILNFDHNGQNPVLYDYASGQRLITDLRGDTVRLVLPPSAGERRLALMSSNAFDPVEVLTPVVFDDCSGDSTTYVMISHPCIYHSTDGTHQLEAYRDYRRSAAGGEHQAEYYDIEKLYDQFAYGIRFHPMAIRNFIAYAATQWPSIDMVYLIGKAREYPDVRNGATTIASGHVVPTFGKPGADNLFTAPSFLSVPEYPIGRIAAISGDEVQIYLEKIKQHDQVMFLPQTVEDKAWTKNVLHLAGGRGSGQQAQLEGFLTAMGGTVETYTFSGEYELFTKASTDFIGGSQLEKILEIIQAGTSVISFFGHSGSQTLDFNINDPEEWNNSGKYPVFSAMGCAAGQIHKGFRSLSEDFIFQDNSGSIAFISGSASEYLSPLATWGVEWYNDFCERYYGEPLGKTIQTSLEYLNPFSFASLLLRQQQTLNGDPAIKIHPSTGPDLVIDGASAGIDPQIVNNNQEKVTLKFDIINIGQKITDSFTVVVRHMTPDGAINTVLTTDIDASEFQTTVTLEIPIEVRQAVGVNTFFVDIDTEEVIIELPDPEAEENNSLKIGNQIGIDFNVIENDLQPLWPDDFGIIKDEDPHFLAITSNPLFGTSNYIFQIDTTELFDSPEMEQLYTSSAGGIIEFDPLKELQPGTVYYWRISPDNSNGPGLSWRHRSFVYLPGSSNGWNQSHYYQFLKNEFEQIIIDDDRTFDFDQIFQDITIRNFAFKPGSVPSISIGPSTMIYWAWDAPVKNGVQVTVFDEKSVEYWKNEPGGLFGSHLPNIAQLNGHANFPFWTRNVEERETLIEFLTKTIPDGNYVVVWSIQRQNTPSGYMPEAWAADSAHNAFKTNLFQALEEQGAQFIRSTETIGPVPFMFAYKKNDPSFTPIEIVTESLEDQIDIDFSLSGNIDNGSMCSSVIGPASSWDRLEFFQTQEEASDMVTIEINGKPSISDTFHLVAETNTHYYLGDLNAADCPYMKIDWDVSDLQKRTTPQLKNWRVYYEGFPDLVINPQKGYVPVPRKITYGTLADFSVFIENYTGNAMQEMLEVSFELSCNGALVHQTTKSYAPLVPYAGRLASFSTKELLPGDYELVIAVNPNRLQKESEYENNSGSIRFSVVGDFETPVPTFTFNNATPMIPGPGASPSNIQITFSQNGIPVKRIDTSRLEFELTLPDSDIVPLNFDRKILNYVPGKHPFSAVIDFPIGFDVPGDYELSLGFRDAHGNIPNDSRFSHVFTLPTNIKTSRIYNHPNPFRETTRFGYLLEGTSEINNVSLQISTLAGTPVCTLHPEVVGSLKPGEHDLDYEWDGRNGNGERLPAGVYVYRFICDGNPGKESDIPDGLRLLSQAQGKLVIVR